MKRITARALAALCLSLLLAAALSVSALAADKAAGADLRLLSTEGTVSVLSANGRALSLRENMKLYSGYTLKTGQKSYAYISLDADKAVKLDAGSEAEIRKQGKQLEVLLKAGQLFFNVKKPLSGGSTLNVRTSTMVTGIRGTSGYVQVVSDSRSLVTVLDGKVEVSTPDAGSYQTFETVTVAAGATGVADDHGAQEHWQLTVEQLGQQTIPGFVLVELEADGQLADRVAQATDLPVAQLAADAPTRLKADQQAARKAQAALDRQAADLNKGGVSEAAPLPARRAGGGARQIGHTPRPASRHAAPRHAAHRQHQPDGGAERWGRQCPGDRGGQDLYPGPCRSQRHH